MPYAPPTHGLPVEVKSAKPKRLNATERGYGRRWRNYRKIFLARNPLCVACKEDGRLTASNVVDHIIPHKGNYDLMWNKDNHQALCKPCHDRKTAVSDGGFGR